MIRIREEEDSGKWREGERVLFIEGVSFGCGAEEDFDK